jgi:hypothetical protein
VTRRWRERLAAWAVRRLARAIVAVLSHPDATLELYRLGLVLHRAEADGRLGGCTRCGARLDALPQPRGWGQCRRCGAVEPLH